MYTLTLYTRPTCSDCQEAKKYLKDNDVNYVNMT
ncbi:glutaredoxin family protein (plasmid) [Alkalihalophilus sp. As8PL]|uniref:Glutaredoxin family protein n=1 Tax=Alkalihalophilus sp. As8PL TaxID=3237103 RepID=A0AB39BNQ6_9BACI